jgi:hypothetical protein
MKTFKVTAQPIVGQLDEKREYTIEAEDEKKAKNIAFEKMMKRELSDALLDSPAQMFTAEEINPTPKKISDLIDNIDYYVAEMRKTEDRESIPARLGGYADSYFTNLRLEDAALKSLAIYTIDKAYRVAGYIEILDNYTRAYFAKVIPRIWDYLHRRGVSIFYIVDNTFGDDGRFEAVVELFRLTGITVITPHDKNGSMNYESIEHQIKETMAGKIITMYIEKDSSVNYLEKVKELATQSDYVCILRNKSFANPNIEILPNRA